jgi:hypothetical protein
MFGREDQDGSNLKLRVNQIHCSLAGANFNSRVKPRTRNILYSPGLLWHVVFAVAVWSLYIDVLPTVVSLLCRKFYFLGYLSRAREHQIFELIYNMPQLKTNHFVLRCSASMQKRISLLSKHSSWDA